jgi:hypothetical protein
MPREVEKVVCYVVHDNHLLVFTHDNQPMTNRGAGACRVDRALGVTGGSRYS